MPPSNITTILSDKESTSSNSTDTNSIAILLVSVELEEVLSLSDRIVVMFDGGIVGERVNKNVTDRELGLLMAGVA